MKKIYVMMGLLTVLNFCGRQTGINFEKIDFAAAQQKAQTEQELLLTYFYTEW